MYKILFFYLCSNGFVHLIMEHGFRYILDTKNFILLKFEKKNLLKFEQFDFKFSVAFLYQFGIFSMSICSCL